MWLEHLLSGAQRDYDWELTILGLAFFKNIITEKSYKREAASCRLGAESSELKAKTDSPVAQLVRALH